MESFFPPVDLVTFNNRDNFVLRIIGDQIYLEKLLIAEASQWLKSRGLFYMAKQMI
jgi:hypothetical protein